jgi:hypothetical protein
MWRPVIGRGWLMCLLAIYKISYEYKVAGALMRRPVIGRSWLMWLLVIYKISYEYKYNNAWCSGRIFYYETQDQGSNLTYCKFF